MGLFCLAIIIHNVLSIIFAPRNLTSINASFFLVVAVMLLGVSCVLLGWYGTTLVTTTPQSLSRGPPRGASLSHLELYHRYPVCTLQLGQDGSLRVVDIALLKELVGARTSEARTLDFSNWFGTRRITYSGIVKELKADGTPWEVHEYLLPTSATTTVLVLNNRYTMSSIVGMVGWVDAIAFSPLSIFMPTGWIDSIVYMMSFATRLIPFAARLLVDDLSDYVYVKKSQLKTDMILTGGGVAGGFLSAAAVQARTHAIAFASPGLLHCSRRFGVSFACYHSHVLSIGAYDGALSDVGGHDLTVSQRLLCDGAALYCMRQQFLSTALLEACGDAEGRRHVPSARPP
ncbi:hypothetical protein CUR178_02572 [Leishmania enriettii]|uniref:Uncharacterized protein n=1 Tax=Leishmania enriettii TaxID=5663 RepID=A0A836KGI2_LEIEN|nr:hypothetical protein CUR178_02572 [Leishmania enriettii]